MKKGMELSINFLVTLILSIVIFSFSLGYVLKTFVEIDKERNNIDDYTMTQINDLVCDGLICITNPGPVKIGESVIFYVQINNVLGEIKEFEVSAHFSKAIDPQDNTITADKSYIDSRWHFFSEPHIYTIDNNNKVSIPVLIKADSSTGTAITIPGEYIFNVNVSSGGYLYDGKIHKIVLSIE